MNKRTAKRRISQETAAQQVHEEQWNPIKARAALVESQQLVISFKNMATVFHKSMFVFAVELRRLDRDNRMFSNGSVTKELLGKIDQVINHKVNDLPPEAYDAFTGDNEPGIAPEHIRGGK